MLYEYTCFTLSALFFLMPVYVIYEYNMVVSNIICRRSGLFLKCSDSKPINLKELITSHEGTLLIACMSQTVLVCHEFYPCEKERSFFDG
jgi:hypothetical protein